MVGVSLAASTTAVAALGGGSGGGRQARGGVTADVLPGRSGHHRPRPPVPRVSTLGVTRSATLVSYCWSEHVAGGGASGTCVDGIPGHPAHTLDWRPSAKLRVDLRLPAHDVQIQAVRITSGIGGRPSGIGGRPSHVVRLHVARVDRAGRLWTVRLPQRSASDTDLMISAFFTDGDIEADLGIRRG
jgi:hypothetical protein